MDLRDLGRLLALAPGNGGPDPLTALLAARPSWHAEAACRGRGTAPFFPERGGDVRPAKALCAACPVAGPCLEWALDQDPDLEGIFAGTSHRERRRLRTERRTAA